MDAEQPWSSKSGTQLVRDQSRPWGLCVLWPFATGAGDLVDTEAFVRLLPEVVWFGANVRVGDVLELLWSHPEVQLYLDARLTLVFKDLPMPLSKADPRHPVLEHGRPARTSELRTVATLEAFQPLPSGITIQKVINRKGCGGPQICCEVNGAAYAVNGADTPAVGIAGQPAEELLWLPLRMLPDAFKNWSTEVHVELSDRSTCSLLECLQVLVQRLPVFKCLAAD